MAFIQHTLICITLPPHTQQRWLRPAIFIAKPCKLPHGPSSHKHKSIQTCATSRPLTKRPNTFPKPPGNHSRYTKKLSVNLKNHCQKSGKASYASQNLCATSGSNFWKSSKPWPTSGKHFGKSRNACPTSSSNCQDSRITFLCTWNDHPSPFQLGAAPPKNTQTSIHTKT